MIGNNAVYLSKQMANLGLSSMDKTQQLDTIKKNEVIIVALMNALEDMSTMMQHFVANDRRCNLYGYKMKFSAIENIVLEMHYSLTNADLVLNFGCGRANYNKIAEDLETISKLLDYEISNNMNVIEYYEKNYKKIPQEIAV